MSTKPMLIPGEVHIWIAPIPSHLQAEIEQTLSPEERDQASRFRFLKDRDAYVFAHAALREILGMYMDCLPREIPFARQSFGRPFVEGDNAGVRPHFSLSHSGAMVLVALSADRQVGVDVEEVRFLPDRQSVAESFFTPQENALIERQAPEDRERTFFQCWTRKEAYIKAMGRGLTISLNSFDTCIREGKNGRLLPRSQYAPGTDWWLADLELPSGYIGAVVLEEGFDRMVYHYWQPYY